MWQSLDIKERCEKRVWSVSEIYSRDKVLEFFHWLEESYKEGWNGNKISSSSLTSQWCWHFIESKHLKGFLCNTINYP